MEIFEKFDTKEEAIKRAEALAKSETYICVVESQGKFYVENDSPLIRVWEEVVFEKIQGGVK